MEMNKKSTNLGGARKGAGRKRTLPEGAKVTSFKITEAERIAVKNFIQEMRNNEAHVGIVNITLQMNIQF